MGCIKLTPIKIKKPKVRKSGFEDMFFVIIVLMAVIIFMIVLSKVWGEMRHPLEAGLNGSISNDDFNLTSNFDKTTEVITLFDSLIPFLLIGIFAFVLIGASVYMQHPMMMIVGIIILGVVILLAVVYSNVYHQIADSDTFADTTDDFPISDMLMKFLPYIAFIMAIGIGVAILFFKGGAAKGL